MSRDLVEYTLRTLKLASEDVANIYLVGSRLFSHFVSKSSDYDVIVVRRPECSGAADVEAIHRNNVDAIVLSAEEFNRRIETHLIERMCLSLPQDNVLREEYRPARCALRLKEFQQNALTRHEHTLHKAAKFQEKGKTAEMRKLLLHALRDHRLYRQILARPEGRVDEFKGLIDEEEALDDDTLWVHCRTLEYL